jgi:hypothetical protein
LEDASNVEDAVSVLRASALTFLEKPSETTVTGTATFTNSTNNIALTGIGSQGLEIGDVVQVTGTASNNKLFTVEVITDDDNVVVNQAHAGGTTTKSLVDETVSATVTLISKWFNASTTLGRGEINLTASRSTGVTYTNPINRGMFLAIEFYETEGLTWRTSTKINGNTVVTCGLNAEGSNDSYGNASLEITAGSTYETSIDLGTAVVNRWTEIR